MIKIFVQLEKIKQIEVSYMQIWILGSKRTIMCVACKLNILLYKNYAFRAFMHGRKWREWMNVSVSVLLYKTNVCSSFTYD